MLTLRTSSAENQADILLFSIDHSLVFFFSFYFPGTCLPPLTPKSLIAHSLIFFFFFGPVVTKTVTRKNYIVPKALFDKSSLGVTFFQSDFLFFFFFFG